MRLLINFLFFGFIFFIVLTLAVFHEDISYASEHSQPIVNIEPSPIPSTLIVIDNPEQLIIPKLGLTAKIIPVGQDKDGRMGVPALSTDVGWYKLGYKVGEKGNAVLAGHLDNQLGQPAIFYNLSKLEIGDIFIVRGQGKQLKFRIDDQAIYAYNNFPQDLVFGESDMPRLNLITCEGPFDQSSQNYLHRLVLHGQLFTE